MSIKHTTVKDLIETPRLAKRLASFMRLADSVEAKQIAYKCLEARYEMIISLMAVVDSMPIEQVIELLGMIPSDEFYEELVDIETELERGLV